MSSLKIDSRCHIGGMYQECQRECPVCVIHSPVAVLILNTSATLWPNYQHTLSDGFIAYLTLSDGSHPITVEVSGAEATYDPALGRLTVTNVTGNLTISTPDNTAIDNIQTIDKMVLYTIAGTKIAEGHSDQLQTILQSLPYGMYITRQGNTNSKILH